MYFLTNFYGKQVIREGEDIQAAREDKPGQMGMMGRMVMAVSGPV